MIKNILLISCVVVVVFGCKQKPESNETTTGDTLAVDTIASGEVSNTDTLKYEIKGFDKQSPNCVNELVNCASFSASFPLINSEEHRVVADSINNFIRDLLYKPLLGEEKPNGLNDMLRPYFQAYNEALQTSQNEGEDSIAAWEFNREFSVERNTPSLLTIEHYERSYAGGAHPNSFSHYHHFNPIDGKKMYLHNFFVDDYRQKLTAIAEKKFRKQLNISPKAKLDDEGFWFTNKVFELTENFWFTNDGIHFLYNPYEVAAYAIGPIEITIPYNELEGLLKPEVLAQLQQ